MKSFFRKLPILFFWFLFSSPNVFSKKSVLERIGGVVSESLENIKGKISGEEAEEPAVVKEVKKEIPLFREEELLQPPKILWEVTPSGRKKLWEYFSLDNEDDEILAWLSKHSEPVIAEIDENLIGHESNLKRFWVARKGARRGPGPGVQKAIALYEKQREENNKSKKMKRGLEENLENKEKYYKKKFDENEKLMVPLRSKIENLRMREIDLQRERQRVTRSLDEGADEIKRKIKEAEDRSEKIKRLMEQGESEIREVNLEESEFEKKKKLIENQIRGAEEERSIFAEKKRQLEEESERIRVKHLYDLRDDEKKLEQEKEDNITSLESNVSENLETRKRIIERTIDKEKSELERKLAEINSKYFSDRDKLLKEIESQKGRNNQIRLELVQRREKLKYLEQKIGQITRIYQERGKLVEMEKKLVGEGNVLLSQLNNIKNENITYDNKIKNLEERYSTLNYEIGILNNKKKKIEEELEMYRRAQEVYEGFFGVKITGVLKVAKARENIRDRFALLRKEFGAVIVETRPKIESLSYQANRFFNPTHEDGVKFGDPLTEKERARIREKYGLQ